MILKAILVFFLMTLVTSRPYEYKFTEQCGMMNPNGFYDWDKLLHWCGHSLAMGMRQICKGNYHYIDPLDNQRSQNRVKRAIVDECCYKCCTARSLKVYCRDQGPDYRKLYIPPVDNETQIYEIYDH